MSSLRCVAAFIIRIMIQQVKHVIQQLNTRLQQLIKVPPNIRSFAIPTTNPAKAGPTL